jgi:hypothetical protein
MTHLSSSRVSLLLETTKNTKSACSAAKIRGRTAFWLLIGCSGALCKSRFWKNSIDRPLFRSIDFGQSFDRSIDFSGPPNFQSFPYEICHSSLIVLQKQKTKKLTKTLENNKAKSLTSANQGVQIHNIWHSSHSIIILCTKTCIFTTNMKYTFNYYEPYFVKMSD